MPSGLVDEEDGVGAWAFEARKLVINPVEAATVRKLFRLYLKHGNARLVIEKADRLGLRTKSRKPNNGSRLGAASFSRRDISVVRADKLFLRIVILPSLGLNPKDFTKGQIAGMLNRYGVSYVVTVPRVWAETPVMARFAAVLESDQFEEVARIPVRGPTAERELVIYRSRGPLADPPEDFEIELRGVGMTLNRD